MNILNALLLTISMAFSSQAFAFPPEIGEVPGLLDKLEYVDGTPLDLATLRGKPVVLYFGADWCVPCVEKGRPTATKVARKYGPMGLEVIFVSMDDNKLRPLKAQEATALGIRIAMPKLDVCPVGKCTTGVRDVGSFGRIYTFPSAVVLDSQGVVRAKMDMGMGVLHGLEPAVQKVIGMPTIAR
ncbi:MAG: TlpA family protein disulfide reductase [Ramlibacter sp.]|nr:TlpA family protein disulfide reductase [Ramlibacter sp.]